MLKIVSNLFVLKFENGYTASVRINSEGLASVNAWDEEDIFLPLTDEKNIVNNLNPNQLLELLASIAAMPRPVKFYNLYVVEAHSGNRTFVVRSHDIDAAKAVFEGFQELDLFPDTEFLAVADNGESYTYLEGSRGQSWFEKIK